MITNRANSKGVLYFASNDVQNECNSHTENITKEKVERLLK